MRYALLVLSVLLITTLPAFALESSSPDLTIQAGEDYVVQVSYAEASGAPVDLTGSTFAADIRATYADAEPLASFAVTLDAPNGTVTLTLPHAVTAAHAKAVGVWDLKRTDYAGLVSYIVRGAVKFVQVVTR